LFRVEVLLPSRRDHPVARLKKGRVASEQVTGLEAVRYHYDAVGRLSTITQGTGVDARTSTLTYNSKNELTGITDPLSRTVGFAYDLAGRITTQTLPDTRTIGYSYDANGNVTAITPPGKPTHTFAYTPVDLEQEYRPPVLGVPSALSAVRFWVGFWAFSRLDSLFYRAGPTTLATCPARFVLGQAPFKR
jgi:YD repeat-containing protein